MRKFDLLVVGSGMYVCGKGTDGFGTLLPAVFEAVRKGWVGKIRLVTRSQATCEVAVPKVKELRRRMRLEVDVRVLCADMAAEVRTEISRSGSGPTWPSSRFRIICMPRSLSRFWSGTSTGWSPSPWPRVYREQQRVSVPWGPLPGSGPIHHGIFPRRVAAWGHKEYLLAFKIQRWDSIQVVVGSYTSVTLALRPSHAGHTSAPNHGN